MKKSIKLISVLLLCLGLTACTPSNKVAKRASHLELNLSSSQLQALYDEKQKSSPSDSEADIDRIIAIGKRNIQWLEILNKNLAANEDRLSFGDLVPATNDMIHPVTYSRKLIVDAYAELEQQTPQGMVAVYNSSAELPIKLTVSRKDYLKYARLTDLIYKRALRWKLLEDQLEDLAAAKVWDIRGYYFLSSRPNLETELAQWSSLPEELKEQLKEWLLGMCGNASDETEASCNFSFDQFAASGDLFKYYKWYLRNSKKMYEANFKIESPRDDIYWDSEKNAFISLLRNDSRTDITDALKLNVERAWQGKDWHLELKFTPDAAVHINFQPGSTPYVMGDLINLDPTSPLTEKYTQVAFKHEYGHILGFPDCYVEFYDKKNQVMVIYTIDLTNIMCAQTGQVQQIHFDELRRVYSKSK